MPYTVHTPDGQTHTYPGPRYVHVNDMGLLSVHRDVPQDRHGSPSEGPMVAAYPPVVAAYPPMVAAYPPGQWTHYHVKPAHDRWKATYQQHLEAGRKAAEAQ